MLCLHGSISRDLSDGRLSLGGCVQFDCRKEQRRRLPVADTRSVAWKLPFRFNVSIASARIGGFSRSRLLFKLVIIGELVSGILARVVVRVIPYPDF